MVDIPTRAAIREKLYDFLNTKDNGFKAWKVVETSTVEYGVHEGVSPSVYRLTCDMDVSLQSFRAFCASTDNMAMVDPHVASIDTPYIDDHSRVECIHIKGKGSSLTAARDFCTYQTMDTLPYKSLSEKEKRLIQELSSITDGPISKNANRGARLEYPPEIFVLSAIDSRTVPEIPDFVRAYVHSLGYIAFPLTEHLIRVVYISCVDPKGNIPKFALDAANAETASRIERIKNSCKVLHNSSKALEFAFPKALCDLGGKESMAEATRTSKLIEKTQSTKSSKSEKSTKSDTPSTMKSATPVHQDPQPSTVVPPLPISEGARPNSSPSSMQQQGQQEPATKKNPPAAAPPTPKASTPETEAAPVPVVEEEVATPVPLSPEERLPERLRMNAAKRAHLSRMVKLHIGNGWRTVKTIENCLLEEQVVDFSAFKAVRISSDFNCSIATFIQVIGDQKNMKVYDPKQETFELCGEDKSIHGIKVYSAYKRESRFISPRDFFTLSAAALLNTPEAIAKEGFGDDSELVYVQGSTSVDGKPEVSGWVRGILHVFGYICFADEADSNRIKVYNVMCADPNGSIPKIAMDAANLDNCKKLAIIRRLCEEQHKQSPAALPVSEAVPDPIKKPKSVANPPTSVAPSSVRPSPEPQKPRSPNSPDSDNESSASFQSCLDEDDLQKDMQSMRQFYYHEVDSVVNRLISLHNFDGWALKDTVDGCRLETVLTPLCDKKAVRASCEMHCTIDDFWHVISNVNLLRRYDQDLEKLDILKSPPYGTVMHTSYRGNKAVQSRDFCTITASKFLADEEGSDANLYTPGFNASALVVNSLDCDDYPEQKGYIRGVVYAHGFIAVATPPTAKRIRVFHLALIDPQGSIPAKLADMAARQLAGKLNTIKQICQDQHHGELALVSDTASYMVQQAHGGDENAPIDPASIIGPFLRQHLHAHWSNTTIINKCTVQTAELLDNPNMLVIRASMEVPCSLSIFESVVGNTDTRRRLDENIESLRFLAGPPNASVSLVGFRRDDNKAPHANIAFCEIGIGKRLTNEEIHDFELSSMKAGVYVYNAIGWEHGLNKEQLASFGSYEMGRMNLNGYMGIAIPPTAPRIRVSHQWCVTTYDSKTEATPDKKHRKNVEFLKHELASRLIMLTAMCQDRQGLKEEALLQVGGGARARSGSDSSDLNARAANTMLTYDAPDSPGRELEGSGSEVPTPPGSPANGMESRAETKDELRGQFSPKEDLTDEAPAPVPNRDLAKREIFSRLLQLHKRHDWNQVKVVDECLLENVAVDYCKLNANKVSTDFACELETFKGFMGDAEKIKEYDPKLETLKLIKTVDGDTQVLYSAYKRDSRLVAPREFLTRNISVLLTHEEAVANGLLKPHNTTGAAFLQLSRSYEEDADLHEVERGWVRGFIHTHGYVAIREGPKGSKKIKIFSISCVDPNGSIPKFAMDAAAAQSCKTIALIRTLCEEEEQKKQ